MGLFLERGKRGFIREGVSGSERSFHPEEGKKE
jgi:hypothetical protein